MDLNTIITVGVSILISAGGGLLVFWGKFASAETQIKNLKEKVDSLEKRLNDACERLAKAEGGLERDRAHNAYVKSESPLSLTDKGKALLLDSTGQSYVDTNKDKLIKEIKTKNPKTAFDVQEIAKQVITDNSSSTDFNSVKDYLFKEGISIEPLIQVLGIYLRDLALPELGFTQDDVDKSDPKKQKHEEKETSATR